MKPSFNRCNLVVVLFLFAAFTGKAQSWINVGSPGFTTGNVTNPAIATDPGGTPYIIFPDSAYHYKASVMKFDGSNWVDVGSPGFSDGTASYVSIAMDAAGMPYVAYQDGGNNNYVTVKKYNGSGWVTVGNPGFSGVAAFSVGIKVDTGSGTPYVVYEASSNIHCNAFVMKYNGSSWVTLGAGPFSTGNTVEWISMTIDKTGVPYVVYEDGQDGPASVSKYDGSVWVPVGGAEFPAGRALNPSITTDSSGVPYVVYVDDSPDDAYSGKATVMKYNGSTWSALGMPGFSADWPGMPVITIAKGNVPCVAYADYGNGQKATVMKYNGSGWAAVGSAGFSAGVVTAISLATDTSGTPYVGYADAANGNKATVMKYGQASGVKEIKNSCGLSLGVYPDPNAGVFTLTIQSAITEKATVTITGMAGEKVKEFIATTNADTEVRLGSLHGIYFVTVTTPHGKESTKIAVW